MKLLFRCEIPGRVCIKKNNLQRRWSFKKKRTVTMASDRFLAWHNVSFAHVNKQWANSGMKRIETPVFAKFYFHFRDHASEADTSNCIEGPADLLTKVGVILDDKLIVSLYAQKEFGLEPKTIIELYDASEMTNV